MLSGWAVFVATLLFTATCHGLQTVNRVGRYLYGAEDSKRFFIKVMIHG